MKIYKYKIQWLFDKTNAIKAIKLIGVRNLDRVLIRDRDLNIIDEYSGFIMHPFGVAENETCKYIRKIFRTNSSANSVELLRR